MDQSNETLADLLSYHMNRRGYGDHKLASLTNRQFPELRLSKSNIRNWREGKASTVRNWQQLVSLAYVLDLTEDETNQLLASANWPKIAELWNDVQDQADRKYLSGWINSEKTDTLRAMPVHHQTNITQIVQQTINQMGPTKPATDLVQTKTTYKWLVLVLGVALVGLLVGAVLWVTSKSATDMSPEPDSALEGSPQSSSTSTSPSEKTSSPSSLEIDGKNTFEQVGDVTPWQWQGMCTYDLLDSIESHTGIKYLAIVQEAEDPCFSFTQQLEVDVEPGEIVRFGGWVSSLGDISVDGRFAISSLGEIHQNSETSFNIPDSRWYCVETTMVVPPDYSGLLEATLFLDSHKQATYRFDDFEVVLGDESICPIVEELPQEDTFAALMNWQKHGNCELKTEQENSNDGGTYLVVDTADPECISIYQDFLLYPSREEQYYLSAWLRNANEDRSVSGELVLWTGNDPIELHGIVENGGVPFRLSGSEWQCVETTLPVTVDTQNTLRTEIYFKTENADYHIDTIQLSREAKCEPEKNEVAGDFMDDFEEKPAAVSWQFLNEDCDLFIRNDKDIAQHGEHYLVVKDNGDDCKSIYQDLYMKLERGDTYYASMWVRADDDLPWEGGFAVWIDPDKTNERRAINFSGGSEWQCVEVEVTIEHDDHKLVRPELYFLSADSRTYHVDNIYFGAESVCSLSGQDDHQHVRNLTQLFIDPVFSGSTVAVTAEIASTDMITLPTGLRYWIANSDMGDSLNGEVLEVPVNALVGNQEALLFYEDIYLPRKVPAGTYYVVIEPYFSDELDQNENNSNKRASLPITVLECLPGSLYCDIGEDFWAWTEVERWYEDGYSRGCLGDTEPFVDKPFCPNMALDHGVLSVFLMRYLKGVEYSPTEEYQGYYLDVPSDHRWALWIEALKQADVELTRESCRSADDLVAYCPDSVVRKGDLAIYLSQILEWELSDMVETPFTDIEGDTIMAKAIAYMWENEMISPLEPDCEPDVPGKQFCPDAPLLRANAAVYMTRAFDFD